MSNSSAHPTAAKEDLSKRFLTVEEARALEQSTWGGKRSPAPSLLLSSCAGVLGVNGRPLPYSQKFIGHPSSSSTGGTQLTELDQGYHQRAMNQSAMPPPSIRPGQTLDMRQQTSHASLVHPPFYTPGQEDFYGTQGTNPPPSFCLQLSTVAGQNAMAPMQSSFDPMKASGLTTQKKSYTIEGSSGGEIMTDAMSKMRLAVHDSYECLKVGSGRCDSEPSCDNYTPILLNLLSLDNVSEGNDKICFPPLSNTSGSINYLQIKQPWNDLQSALSSMSAKESACGRSNCKNPVYAAKENIDEVADSLNKTKGDFPKILSSYRPSGGRSTMIAPSTG